MSRDRTIRRRRRLLTPKKARRVVPQEYKTTHTVFPFEEIHLMPDQKGMVCALNTISSYCLAISARLSSSTAKVTREELAKQLEFIHNLHFFSDGTPCIGKTPQTGKELAVR